MRPAFFASTLAGLLIAVRKRSADLLIVEATRRGNSLGDYVAKVLCDRFAVPFEPRVKKKALRAWQMADEAGEQLPMTG